MVINVYSNIKQATGPGFSKGFEIRTWYAGGKFHAVTGVSDGINFTKISDVASSDSEVKAVLELTSILPFNANLNTDYMKDCIEAGVA